MQRPVIKHLVLALCLAVLVAASWQSGLTSDDAAGDAVEGAPVIALVGGRLLTQTDQGAVTADLLIRDGRIAAIGSDLEIPDEARRIDVRGMTITPGLIDARSTLWLTPAAADESAGDGGLDVLDGVDPLAEDWREVARQGVTAVYVQPASSGNLGGSGAVLAVAPAAAVEDLVIRAPAGAQASLGVGGSSRTSRDRHAQYERLKKTLDAAKTYGQQWKKYREYEKQQKSKSAAAEKNAPNKGDRKKQGQAGDDAEKKAAAGKSDDAKSAASKPPSRPTKDVAKEFLLKVLAREVPLRIEAHREDDVAAALKLAADFKVRVTLDGASNPRLQLADVVAGRTPLVLGPVVELGSVPAYRERRPEDWLTSLTAHDPRWALASFGETPRSSRLLRVQAAAAVAHGVPARRVLRAMTADAAAILGVDDQLGSIAAGRRADLAVFAGDPLDPATPVRLTMSRGRIVYQAEVDAPPPDEAEAEAIHAADPLPAQLPNVFLIASQRVLTDAGTWQAGRLLVESGRIAPLDAAAELPEDIPVYDLGAAPVTPGLLIAHAELDAAVDDQSDPVAAHLLAADAFDPGSQAARQLLEAGFLRVALAPGSRNVVGGSVCLLRLGAAPQAAGNGCGLKLVLTAAARDANRYPASLAGQVELLTQILQGHAPDTPLFLPDPVRRELLAERARRIEAVREKRSAAMFAAGSAAEIRAALQLIAQHELRGVLIGPTEIEPFIEQLRQLDVGVVARPVTADDYDRYVDALSAAARAGVPLAFGSGSARQCRMTAALAINAGLPPQAALQALTDRGAQLVGAPAGTCSLAPGAPADLVIWSGSPLDLRSRPRYVLVDGQLAFAAPHRAGSAVPPPSRDDAPERVARETR